MSEENVALFRKSAAAVGRDDWDTVIALTHTEVVFIPQRAPVQGSYVGHDDMRRFAADTRETFDVFAPEYPDVRDLGDRVLAIGSLRIRGRGSQVETSVPSAIVVDFEAGLMTRFQDYGDPRLALEAVGLPE
jgi:ketosteroid isomerase-like protein